MRFAPIVKACALILVVALATTATLFAEQYGTKFRTEFEKEKNGPHGQCRTGWTTLQPGLQYRSISCLGDEADLDLHVVRIDVDRWNLDTVVVSPATGRTIAQDNDASFVVNANFFDRARAPLGAVVQSGSVVHAPRASSWQSIFLIDGDRKPLIVMPPEWSSHRDKTRMAVQAGPRLVVSAHTLTSFKRDDAAARAGVCIGANGDLLFFATPQNRKLQIIEIARVAQRDEIDGGLACREAMLFDGGHSVNFFVAGDKQRVSVEGDPVPVFVVATRHRAGDASQTK